MNIRKVLIWLQNLLSIVTIAFAILSLFNIVNIDIVMVLLGFCFLFFGINGLIQRKRTDNVNKVISYINILLGIGILLLVILTWSGII